MKKILSLAMVACFGVMILQPPPVSAQGHGALKIITDPPNTTVYVNGKKKGTSTPLSLKLAEGDHTIRLENPNCEIEVFTVIVGADTVQQKEVKMKTLQFPRKSPLPESKIIKTMPMVSVPAGEFEMGSDEHDKDKPVHTVWLDAYKIDKYEVTAWQFAQFLNAKGNPDGKYIITGASCTVVERGGKYYARAGYENHPANWVSWFGAEAYASWIGKRLPTEAEWEKAARGTDGRKYPWGNNAPGKNHDLAVYNIGDTKVSDMQPADSLSAGKSPYGAHHMAGNVCEWCQDWYYKNYYNSSGRNPTGPYSGSARVIRGGSWLAVAGGCRVACRGGGLPGYRYGNNGFRLALSPGQ